MYNTVKTLVAIVSPRSKRGVVALAMLTKTPDAFRTFTPEETMFLGAESTKKLSQSSSMVLFVVPDTAGIDRNELRNSLVACREHLFGIVGGNADFWETLLSELGINSSNLELFCPCLTEALPSQLGGMLEKNAEWDTLPRIYHQTEQVGSDPNDTIAQWLEFALQNYQNDIVATRLVSMLTSTDYAKLIRAYLNDINY